MSHAIPAAAAPPVAEFEFLDHHEVLHATLAEAEAAVLEDYRAVLGRLVRPLVLLGYDDVGNQVEIDPADGRIAVRVLQTPECDLLRDMGGAVDPCWTVEVVEDPDGETMAFHADSWVVAYGRSHLYPEGR